MSLTHLFVIRHGETDFNKKNMMQGRSIDAPLNKTGKKQAIDIASALKNEMADQLVVSSMIRTIQTGQPLAKHLSMPIQSYEELDEMNFGDFEGRKSKEIKEELDRVHNEWASGNVSMKIPGGESPAEVFERANGRIQQLISGFDETIILILHGRLIRILLSEWLGYGLENMHKIQHQNGAINLLVKNRKSYEPEYLNKTDHLSAD